MSDKDKTADEWKAWMLLQYEEFMKELKAEELRRKALFSYVYEETKK